MEWPTLAAILACYVCWGSMTWVMPRADAGGWLLVLALVPVTTFHSSLQHEVLHGHPTRNVRLNESLVWLPLGFLIPFRRFKVLHLRHHRDETLTDPYDDPESFYRAEADWHALDPAVRFLCKLNNTLIGRLVLGPGLSFFAFATRELRLLRDCDRCVGRAWFHHVLGVVTVSLWLVAVCGWPLYLYLAAVAYPAMSVLMIRTFAEHRAHSQTGAQSIIVENGGFFSLLFLNNHLHFVHHDHPRAAWYRLPALYRGRMEEFRARSGGYVVRSYGEIARRYLFCVKEPPVHPYRRRQ